MTRARAGSAVALTVLGLAVVLRLEAQRPPSLPSLPAGITAADVFQISKVWTLHLTFTPAEWQKLRPEGSGREGPRTDGFRGPEGKRNGLSALRGLDFEYVHATLDFESRRFTDIGVRYKGNGTYRAGLETGKLSLKLDLNKFVKGQKLAGLSTINLHTNITDASWMNEVLAFRLFRDARAPAPRTSYARVFLTVPGTHARTYMGLYSLVENIDTNFTTATYGVDGGAIFKPVTQTLFRDLGADWTAYNQTYDPKTDLTPADEQRLIDVSKLVTSASDQTFDARIAEFIDLDAFARNLAVVAWLGNPDSLLQQGQNYYLYLHPNTRKLSFIPWDQDHSFGQFAWSSEEQQRQLDILHPWTTPNRLLERTFRLPAFRTPYLAAMAELTRTVTDPDRLSRQVDELAAVLGPVVATEPVAARIELFKRAVAGQSYTRSYPVNSGTVAPLKAFVRVRQAAVLAQLARLGSR